MANSAQVAWLHGLMDFVFPYLIQFLRQYSTNVDLLMADRKVRCAAACLCLRSRRCCLSSLALCAGAAGPDASCCLIKVW